MTKVFHEGQRIDMYTNPELKEGYLGKGVLIEYMDTSLPILLRPSKISEALNLHYVIEYWIVDLNGVLMRKGIRRPFSIGHTPSGDNSMTGNTSAVTENFVILEDYDTSFWANRVTGSEIPTGSMY